MVSDEKKHFQRFRAHDAIGFEPQVRQGALPSDICYVGDLKRHDSPGCTTLTQPGFGLRGQFTWFGQEVSLAAHRTIVGPSPLSNQKNDCRNQCSGPNMQGEGLGEEETNEGTTRSLIKQQVIITGRASSPLANAKNKRRLFSVLSVGFDRMRPTIFVASQPQGVVDDLATCNNSRTLGTTFQVAEKYVLPQIAGQEATQSERGGVGLLVSCRRP